MKCFWARCQNEATETINERPVCDDPICQDLLRRGFTDLPVTRGKPIVPVYMFDPFETSQ